MSSTQSNSSYYGMENQETDHSWQLPTIIEDDDLMFDGKPLSDIYEEDRRRLSAASSGDEEEERRGRQRVRQEYSSSKKN